MPHGCCCRLIWQSWATHTQATNSWLLFSFFGWTTYFYFHFFSYYLCFLLLNRDTSFCANYVLQTNCLQLKWILLFQDFIVEYSISNQFRFSESSEDFECVSWIYIMRVFDNAVVCWSNIVILQILSTMKMYSSSYPHVVQ